MQNTAVDFAASLISPTAIKAAGHVAVLAYVSPARPSASWMKAKPITREYADKLKAAGLEVVSIWQYGKPGDATPSDWTTGYWGGRDMALKALQGHNNAGGPNHAPIYFAVDEDIREDDWDSQAVQWFRGLCDAIGRDRVGVYGHDEVCRWAIRDGVIGKSAEGKYWAWQTKAWSEGDIADGIVLYQRVVDTASSPGPKIDGSAVDVNDILAADYGQWSLRESPKGDPSKQEGDTPVVPKPNFTELDRFGNSSSQRFGSRITNWLLHTQEGGGTAESLAGYLNNSANGVSYHYTIANGVVCNVVDTDRSSWSVLDANGYTINACFAGSRAAWTRDEWLARENDLRIAAYLAVQDARKYGLDPAVIPPPYTHRDGISDHRYVTDELGIGNHTDVGRNFPWDHFAAMVNEYATGTVEHPKPQPNAIDDCAARNPWLGKRLTVGENATPDGRGRYAQFEAGFVYWHPSTGAAAIPTQVFDKWASLGWESGPLGYPIGGHTALPGGTVQGFQGGAIYRKTGQPGYWVHGEIRNRWNRMGFEGGPFGWPISDEEPFDGGARQLFENGVIYWPGKRSTVALLNKTGADTPVPDKT